MIAANAKWEKKNKLAAINKAKIDVKWDDIWINYEHRHSESAIIK